MDVFDDMIYWKYSSKIWIYGFKTKIKIIKSNIIK